MRLKLTIAYDGRPFLGWQSQPGGNTVQDKLQSAITSIVGEKIGVSASGRTDTGVHALGQVAHFDTPHDTRMTAADWQRALNSHLPPSIRILKCTEVPPDFHSRFNALQKEYEYRIYTGDILPPLLHGLAWHVPKKLDPSILHQALQTFVGTHDFRNFAAFRGTETEEDLADPACATRTIHRADVEYPHSAEIVLRFIGTGFLYKMVRLLTGSAVHCARGKAGIEWLSDLLDPSTRSPKSHHAAPAEGLYLVRVTFP